MIATTIQRLISIILFLLIITSLTIGSSDNNLRAEETQEQQVTILYVSTGNGTDNPTCGTDAFPCRNIQYAVNKAASGDEIRVAGGMYRYDQTTDICNLPLTMTAVVCILNKELTLKGGYSTTNWSIRDFSAHETTIYGDFTYRGMLVSGSTTKLTMEGFTIKNNLAQGLSNRPGDYKLALGGGMFVDTVSKLVLNNIIFKENRALGSNTQNDPAWSDGGTGAGGGLALHNVNEASMTDILFEGNRAIGGIGRERGGYGTGGGLQTHQSTVEGTNLQFVSNIASGGAAQQSGIFNGARANGLGGGASLQDGTVATLQNVEVRGNQATGGSALSDGGYGFGGGIFVEKAENVKIINVDMQANIVRGGEAINGGIARGGGIEIQDSFVSIERAKAIGNQAIGGNGTTGDKGPARGGGISAARYNPSPDYETRVQITNALLAENVVNVGNGSNATGGGGGGLSIQAARADVKHLTIVDNRLGEGVTGAAILATEVGNDVSVTVLYSIIANHIGVYDTIFISPASSLTLDTNLFSNNSSNINGLANNINPIFADDVGFVDPANKDYHLGPSSAAIDQAIGSTLLKDLDDNDRDVIPDIGAYEAEVVAIADTPTATPTSTSTATSTFTPSPTWTRTNTPTRTPTDTPTPTFTPTSAIIPDEFERDNDCDSAQPISTDNTIQRRNFHAERDVDWVRTDVISGTTYHVSGMVPADSPADVNVELYINCAQSVDAIWLESFTPHVSLNFEARHTGSVYLRLANHDPGIFGSHVAYTLNVRKVPESNDNRALIIVAGRLKLRDRLQDNIHYVTRNVYETFLHNGYTDGDIHYLATDSNLDGYDEAADLRSLEAAITDWAAQQLEPGGVLNIYIIDHGDIDEIYIDHKDNTLTPDMLDNWLTTLEEKVEGLSINIIIESCESGSFISPNGGTISGERRLVIASTNDSEDAFALRHGGAYFSDQFITWISQGYNLRDSFEAAKSVAFEAHSIQQAWIDGNGNGIHNENEDLDIAAQVAFDKFGTFGDVEWAPHIFDVEVPSLATINSSGTIYADVRDDGDVAQVSVVIYPPSYVPPETIGELQLQSELLEVVLLSKSENCPNIDPKNCYAGISNFVEEGEYRIAIHAKDGKDLSARPVEVKFTVPDPTRTTSPDPGPRVYLPVITR